jgi:hypothetical protein
VPDNDLGANPDNRLTFDFRYPQRDSSPPAADVPQHVDPTIALRFE